MNWFRAFDSDLSIHLVFGSVSKLQKSYFPVEMSPVFGPEALWEEKKRIKKIQEKSRYIFWGGVLHT